MFRQLLARALAGTIAAHLGLAAVPGFAQPAEYIHRAWGTNDGLPQNTITTMVQTRDGYLWLGTFGGLVRFDGQTFTVFDPANTPGLSSARITTLYESKAGVLWIGTEVGLARYEAGEFRSYTVNDGLPGNGISAIIEDGARFLVGTSAGTASFDGHTFSKVTVLGSNQAPVEGIDSIAQSMVADANGTVWIGTWLSMARMRSPMTADIVHFAGSAVRQLLIDSAGRLWAASADLWRWDGSRFVNIPLPVPATKHGSVMALAEDREGGMWVGTVRGGLFRLQNGIFEDFTAAGLTNSSIRSLLVDRDGNIWVGTDIGGLHRLKRRRAQSFLRPGTGEQSIGPIVGDGAGGLWIGATCGGLLHFREGAFRVYDEAAGLPHPCVWALHRDADGTLWIGTMGAGLVRMRDGKFSSFGTTTHGLVHVIMRDREGRLWVGANSGLSVFENDGLKAVFHHAEYQGVSTIIQDRAGALWLGGSGGVRRFQDGRVTATYTTAEGLSHNHVRAIHEDADGVIWIGTYGGGLNRLKDGRITTYGLKEGLPDVAVSRIIEDDRGFLWMSGNRGVYRVARRQLNDLAEGRTTQVTSITYGTADGMLIDETNGGQPAGWRTADGRFWFPTIKGLVSIDPEGSAAPKPPVFVERAVINGTSMATRALDGLGPGHADAELHYTAVDLGAAEKTRFRYRLHGYDPNWIEAGTRRVAYYTQIPPGSYRFEVMATDSDGAWGGAATAVSLVVTPLWWQLRWVQGLGLVLLLVATGLIVRDVSLRRARARVRELEREQAVERERSRIARDLHDDLGSRLAQIALIADDPSLSNLPRPSDQIANVARDAMRTMDELVWTVNARNDTVDRFAEFAAEFAEEHLRIAGIRCRLQFPADLEARPLAADTRRHLFLAFKEAIHNVVKHAGASEVHVSLAVEPAALVLAVDDNGRGLPDAMRDGTGNGLENMQERMQAVGGSVAFESPSGAGTRVVFRAPLPARP